MRYYLEIGKRRKKFIISFIIAKDYFSFPAFTRTNKGLVIINTQDRAGRKYNFFSKKLITHPTFASNFHTPSENLPKLSYPNNVQAFNVLITFYDI